MTENKKVFAFKLAEKKQAEISTQKKAQFKAREGVSVAGCTDPRGLGAVRYSDTGMYC